MNAPTNSVSRELVKRSKIQKTEPVFFLDLDGTLIWTWSPLITNDFMSAVYGLPICTPPKPKDGYLRLTKVPVGNDGGYCLTCRRPNIGHFLRSLRALGDVNLLTHASRDYAGAMNRVFELGFTDKQIFTYPKDRKTLVENFGTHQHLTMLVDDEGPGQYRHWLRRNCSSNSDHRAVMRHREKCACIGIKPNSCCDIAYPGFSGLKDDCFFNKDLRCSIVRSIARVLSKLMEGELKQSKQQPKGESEIQTALDEIRGDR